MALTFVNGDIVMFRSDSARRIWKITSFSQDGKEASIELLYPAELKLSPDYTEQAYLHLLTLAEPLMQFFRFAHLPRELQDKSFPFWELANKIVYEFPRNPERTVALRKLLEAKDAAVRSTIYEG